MVCSPLNNPLVLGDEKDGDPKPDTVVVGNVDENVGGLEVAVPEASLEFCIVGVGDEDKDAGV